MSGIGKKSFQLNAPPFSFQVPKHRVPRFGVRNKIFLVGLSPEVLSCGGKHPNAQLLVSGW